MSPSKTVKKTPIDSEPIDSNVSCELHVPTISDVVFKYTWRIRKYLRTVSKRDSLDSPVFECAVNGVVTKWQVGIRFWRGPNGKRITNPVAVCLSLVSCSVPGGNNSGNASPVTASPGEQARIKFQLGIRDTSIHHWELFPVSRVALHLANTTNMLSVGFRDMAIDDRHVDKDGDMCLMVKLQLIPTDTERHTLSQDLGKMLSDANHHAGAEGFKTDDYVEDSDTNVLCHSINKGENTEPVKYGAHSHVVKARSSMLATMLRKKEGDTKYTLDLTEFPADIVYELLRYMYTDKVESLDTNASRLLSFAHRFYLDGLKELCERSLVETLTPNNVGNVLLLADQCNCPPLKRAALAYCEENMSHAVSNNSIEKSLAWRVMELVNPELYYEACEASMASSTSSNLDSQGSRSDEHM